MVSAAVMGLGLGSVAGWLAKTPGLPVGLVGGVAAGVADVVVMRRRERMVMGEVDEGEEELGVLLERRGRVKREIEEERKKIEWLVNALKRKREEAGE